MRRSWMVVVLLGACADDSFGPPPLAGSGGASDESGSDGAAALPDEQPFRLVDQSGAEFVWDCEAEGEDICRVRRIESVSPELADCLEDESSAYTYLGWRFFEIVAACASEDSSFWLDDWSRFVVCDADADCPHKGQTRFECRAGFCQNEDTETYPAGLPNARDLKLLCLGDGPRFETDYETQQELSRAVGDACFGEYGKPCQTIPEGCPDPS